MNRKEMNDLIDDYRTHLKYLEEEEVQKEIAIRLYGIFLQLRELEEAINSMPLGEG